ncbi:TPA: hypothetical protein ACTWRU_003737 [Clostridioides difficile]
MYLEEKHVLESMSLKDISNEFYVIRKDTFKNKQKLKIKNSEQFNDLCEELNYLSDKSNDFLERGYLVFRHVGKKLNNEQIRKIKSDIGTYREKAKKYGVSPATISKVMNDKY